jgi:hypothetical protein
MVRHATHGYSKEYQNRNGVSIARDTAMQQGTVKAQLDAGGAVAIMT